MTEFANIALPLIVSSLTNPRKTFNAANLTELANSIKATGVHQPILVRPLPGSRVEETSWEPGTVQRRAVRPTYEIVAGERRYRASKQAGVETIPAMIRELDDDQVLEIQIIENLQRDDLTELEEAEGYQALMEHSQIRAEDVGGKIGKSRSYVYARLKLLDLSLECKQALREGQIDASRALLIARIPDGALQAKALEEATRKGGFENEVPSVRSLQTWLKQNVMLYLDKATFKITDARLVKQAGSCKDCPKRTGADPDLFADVHSADMCTDPACYHGKEEAHRSALVAQAEKKGMRLIEGKEARQIVTYRGILDGYLPLSQVREDAATLVGSMKEGLRAPTLRELLGKDAPSPVLIEHPQTKEMIEAVPIDEAEALLVARGLIKATKAQNDKVRILEEDIEDLQSMVKQRTEHAVTQARYHAVRDGIHATPDGNVAKLLTGDVLREWLQAQLGSYIEAEEMAAMLGYTFQEDEDEDDSLCMHIRAASTATLMRALLIYLLSEDKPRFLNKSNEPTIVKALAQAMELDVTAIEKEAAASVKAEVTQELKRLKGELKAATTATPVAASESSTGGEGGEKTKATKAPARKPKLSAAEAMSGIAAAMLGVEASAAAPDGAVAQTSSTTTWAPADPLLASAKALVVRDQKASVRQLKSELSIGTTKALALMDQLEQAAVVSACDQRGAREVLVQA